MGRWGDGEKTYKCFLITLAKQDKKVPLKSYTNYFFPYAPFKSCFSITMLVAN
ncbi:MAG TPA: hypothetical protein VK203_00270 [Nostocaceae cyanobacterium]|nr:hypothetical protein [Nostocaceae cyanobacterium]